MASLHQIASRKKAPRILLALLLVAGLMPVFTLAAASEARAATPVNQGNPFENGDFVWDDYTQTYKIAGMNIRVGDIRKTHSPGYDAAPFPYPECFIKAEQLGTADFRGWGVSQFKYGYIHVLENLNGIQFTTLPDTAHCAQRGYEATSPHERDAHLLLIEENSWWEGSVYHACFIFWVNGTWVDDEFDQATAGMTYVYADWVNEGRLSLDKDSTAPEITNDNRMYSLAGAEYGIFRSQADADVRKNAVEVLVTDDEGKASSGNLPAGMYYVREMKPSEGFKLDEAIYDAQVVGGETRTANAASGGIVRDVPKTDTAQLLLGKHDGERTYSDKGNLPQGAASLAGARFEVAYYDSVYATPELAEASSQPVRRWVFETDSDGFIRLDDSYKVDGDKLYRIGGACTLPLGTYLVTEIAAPRGYLLPQPVPTHLITVTAEGFSGEVNGYNAPIVPNEVGRGGVIIGKNDAETGEGALGGATLKGAVFRIVNESDHAVFIDGAEVPAGGWVCDIETDQEGFARTAEDLLPYGTYSVTEVNAPEGYLGTDLSIVFSIEQDGEIEELVGGRSFKNQVKRGDLELIKADELTNAKMAGIPFLIASETTGEAHVIVTDANGYASTAASWNPHTQKTNGNDNVENNAYDSECGVWFGMEAGAPTRDDLGALPFDTYTVEELACSANEGHELVKLTGIEITRDKHVVDLGTIDNLRLPEPTIDTTASDAEDGDSMISRSANTVINDVIEYTHLEAGSEYRIVSAAILREDASKVSEGNLDAALGSAEGLFVPETAEGTTKVQTPCNTGGLEGGQMIVMYEWVYDKEGSLVLEHADPDDADQTVTVEKPDEPTVIEEPTTPGEPFDKTGTNARMAILAAGALAVLGATVLLIGIKRRRGQTPRRQKIR